MQNLLISNPPFSFIQPLILKWKFNLKIIGIFSLLIIGALLIFFIFQVNTMVKETYLIKNYEKQFSQLSQENQALLVLFSQVNSLENLEVLVKNLGFEKVGKIHYIRALEGTVVTK